MVYDYKMYTNQQFSKKRIWKTDIFLADVENGYERIPVL